jgi:hypothetical protein
MVGYIICGICLAVSAGIIIRSKVKKAWRISEYSDWQVGDLVCTWSSDTLYTVLGWELSGFYIEKDGATHKIDWDKFNFNKSAIWRRNYQACEKAMGKDPGFSADLKNGNRPSGNIDGKHIDLLTEIECQVYLKQALDSENYELAEKIKEQMKKYR